MTEKRKYDKLKDNLKRNHKVKVLELEIERIEASNALAKLQDDHKKQKEVLDQKVHDLDEMQV